MQDAWKFRPSPIINEDMYHFLLKANCNSLNLEAVITEPREIV